MAKAIFRSDNMSATKDASLLKSAKYLVSTTETTIENGNVVALDGLLDGHREVFKATTPAVNSTFYGIVSTPELMYDETPRKGLADFANEAGAIIRVTIPTKGDIFSVTAEAFSTTPSVGNLVELQANTKLKAVATATSGSTQVGKIIAKDGAFYVIQVM